MTGLGCEGPYRQRPCNGCRRGDIVPRKRNANEFMQLYVALQSFVEFISPSEGQVLICAYLCFHQVARKDVKSQRLHNADELFASQRRRLAPENAPDNFGLLDRDLDSIIGHPLLCGFKC